ncbi:hypothetical protein M8J75_016012 [Diaphorina citri]|nr:hypothetical protein M8J75_016012 [Diaphorina citri]
MKRIGDFSPKLSCQIGQMVICPGQCNGKHVQSPRSIDKIIEGITDKIIEGITDKIIEGITDKIIEGITDKIIERITDKIVEGIVATWIQVSPIMKVVLNPEIPELKRYTLVG